MAKIWHFIFILSLTSEGYAHEKWFFSKSEIYNLNHNSPPLIFTQLGFFNITIICLAFFISILWIISDKPCQLSTSSMDKRIKWSAFVLRITTGIMLFLSGIGILSKFGTAPLSSTLFAPDLLIPVEWFWLKWIEISLSIFLVIGFLTRITAILFIILLFFSIYMYGSDAFQYFGFYLATFLFLSLNGAGYISLPNKFKKLTYPYFSIILLQFLSGINFIYSAISIKFMQPNLDIALLKKSNAYTFGIPYDYFTFLMCIIEISIGFLIISGARLNILGIFLLILFTFLSIDVSENIILHLFIYGILFTLILLKGINIFKLKPYRNNL